MIETIMERFKNEQYNTPNGAKLFLIDMEEVRLELLELKEEIRTLNHFIIEDLD